MLEFFIIATVLVVLGLCLLPVIFPEDPVLAFHRECRNKHGMDFHEASAALSIRMGFVRLRREASNLCLERKGDISREQIAELSGLIALGISAAYGQEAAKSFAGWVGACPNHEILYPDAQDVRLKYLQSTLVPVKASSQTLADMRAAVKMVRR